MFFLICLLTNWLTNWLTNVHYDLLGCFRSQKTKNEKQRKFRMDSNWSTISVPHPQPSSTLSLHPTEIPASVPTLGHGQHCSVLRLLSLNMLKLVPAFHCHWSSSRLIKCQAEDEACECPGPDFQRDWAQSWSASDHAATLDKVSRGVERCEGCCCLRLSAPDVKLMSKHATI